MNTNNIKAIYGPALTNGEGDAYAYTVGNEITSIKSREQSLGSYGILWYDIYKGDVLLSSHNAADVGSVHYETS